VRAVSVPPQAVPAAGVEAPLPHGTWLQLVEASGALVCRIDAATLRCRYVSPSVERMTGWSAQEWLEPGAWLDRLHPDDAAWLLPERQEALRATGQHRAEYRMRRRDGGTVWFACSVQQVPPWPAPAVELVAVMSDVTAAREAGAALARDRDHHAALLDDFPAPVWRSDADGACEYINAAWQRVTGRGPDLERGSGWTAGVHPDDLPGCLAAFSEALAARVPFTLEYRLRGADGRYRHVSGDHRPFRDADGAYAGYLGVLFDLTELRASQESLAEQRQFLAAVLDNLSDAVVACDAQGRLSVFNPAAKELHGLPPEPVPSHTWAEHYDLYRADGRTRMQPDEVPLARALAGEVVRDAGMVVAPRGRPPHELLASGQPIVGPDGQLRGAVVAMHDVTSLRAAEALRAEQARLAARASSAARLARLADVALQLGSVQTLEDLTRVVFADGLEVLGAEGGSIAVRTPGSDQLQVTVTASLGEATQQRYAVLPLDGPLPTSVAARGQRVLLPDADAAVRYEGMAEALELTGTQAWAVLPLRVGDRLVGSIAVGWAEPQQFRDDDLALLDAFAAQCASALDRLLALQAEREGARAVQRLSEALQRSLLTQPPEREDVSVVVRYQPSAQLAQVGGDWYDAFATSTGATILTVGDVSGHDQTAAAGMAQVRNLLRGLAVDSDEDPAALLGRLDRALATLELDVLATAVVARLDPGPDGGRRLRWSSAGHLPALLREPSGRVRLLDADGSDLMLGVDPAAPRTEHAVDLAPGATVLLYTDGLVERRDRGLDDGVEQLRRALEDGPAPSDGLEGLCDALLAAVAPDGSDDIAVLLLHCH
jgi:PAS domain S-box-containing protein